jgi:hypothetical protein
LKLDLIQLPPLKRIDGPDGRCYQTPEGNRYPSITTVLSSVPNPELEAWKNRVGREGADDIASKAAARGTLVHNACENYIFGTKPKFGFLEVEAADCFESLKPIIDSIDTVRAVEIQLHSDKIRVAGSADLIAVIDGELKVVDWKTSSRRKDRSDIPGYFMQCAAYAYMFHERTGLLCKTMKVCIASSHFGVQVFDEPVLPWIKKFIQVRNNFTKTF